MRMRSTERRPKIRLRRLIEDRQASSFPSAARSCVRCSDAPVEVIPAIASKFCSPSALSGETLARPSVHRAASRAIGPLVADSRSRSSRPQLLRAPTAGRATFTAQLRRDDGTSNCRVERECIAVRRRRLVCYRSPCSGQAERVARGRSGAQEIIIRLSGK